MTKKKEEFVSVKMTLEVNGKLARMHEKKFYGRSREVTSFNLSDFARIIFMYDKIFAGHSTYLYDGVLQEMEKKLPIQNGETAEVLFQKYWVNLSQTLNEEFEKVNKGDGEDGYFPEENDYLKFQIYNLVNDFETSPEPVKYGFIYWFYKVLMGDSLEELQKDRESVPKSIIEIVESIIE